MGLKAIEYCKYRFKDGRDYAVRTQDYTDEEFRKAVDLVKPVYWEDLEDYLSKLTDDPEVLAHLKGFQSAEERQQMIAETKRLQEEYIYEADESV